MPNKGDLACKYKLNIQSEIFTHRQIIFNPMFKISLDSKFKTKKWESSSWKKTSLDANMKHLVYHTLNFELTNHIIKTAKSNLIPLAKFNSFKDIPKDNASERINCDHLGRIITDQESEHHFSLSKVLNIYNVENYNETKVNYLKWEAHDLPKFILDDTSIDKCTVNQLIKYAVISMSIDLLAKKLRSQTTETQTQFQIQTLVTSHITEEV